MSTPKFQRLSSLCNELEPQVSIEKTKTTRKGNTKRSKKPTNQPSNKSQTPIEKPTNATTSRVNSVRVKGSTTSTSQQFSKSLSAKAKKARVKGPEKKNSSKDKKTRKPKKRTGPMHWIEESDEFVFEKRCNAEGDDAISHLRMKVRGNPRPLQRHRSSRGFMYNPSEPMQESFRTVFKERVFSDETVPLPLFDTDKILVMTIVFRLRRPRNHFVGNKAGPGRMRPNAPAATSKTRTDVDNLIKFVLDSMNEIMYQDDLQIMSIHATKLLDDEGLCEGSTEISIGVIDEAGVENLISKSFKIAD